jgi:hypothetical protein
MSTQRSTFRHALLVTVAMIGAGLPISSLLSSSAAMAQTVTLTPSPCRRVTEFPFRRLPVCPPSQPIILVTPPPVSPQPVLQGQSTAPINAPGDSALPPAPNPPKEFTIPPGTTLPLEIPNP